LERKFGQGIGSLTNPQLEEVNQGQGTNWGNGAWNLGLILPKNGRGKPSNEVLKNEGLEVLLGNKFYGKPEARSVLISHN